MSDLQTDEQSFLHTVSAPMTAVRAPHILMADGDATSREIREAQLRGAGFRVSVARTWFEAIVKACCHLPDAILLDDSLGNQLAVETGQLLTRCPVTSHIPVVRLRRSGRLPQRMLTRLRKSAA